MGATGRGLLGHDRRRAPVLVDDKLMLAEGACITVVDLTSGGRTEITPLPPGIACAPATVANGVLFARSHGKVIVIDRGGVRAGGRLPKRVEQLFAGDGTRAYAIGKGHLTALNVQTNERGSLP